MYVRTRTYFLVLCNLRKYRSIHYLVSFLKTQFYCSFTISLRYGTVRYIVVVMVRTNKNDKNDSFYRMYNYHTVRNITIVYS